MYTICDFDIKFLKVILKYFKILKILIAKSYDSMTLSDSFIDDNLGSNRLSSTLLKKKKKKHLKKIIFHKKLTKFKNIYTNFPFITITDSKASFPLNLNTSNSSNITLNTKNLNACC